MLKFIIMTHLNSLLKIDFIREFEDYQTKLYLYFIGMLIDGFLVIVTKLSSFLDVLRRDHANGYRLRRDSCQFQVCINTPEAF